MYQCDRSRPRLESQDVWGVDFGYYFELVARPKRGKQCVTFGLVNQVVIWTDFGLRVPIWNGQSFLFGTCSFHELILCIWLTVFPWLGISCGNISLLNYLEE